MIPERRTAVVEELLVGDRELIVWWGTPVECQSAVYRQQRSGLLPTVAVQQALIRMRYLLEDADRVPPVDQILERAGQVLTRHSLRAADAFQLGAALTWCKGAAGGRVFVCLDDRLREAAQREGFTVLPAG
jgi:hypothetical protein